MTSVKPEEKGQPIQKNKKRNRIIFWFTIGLLLAGLIFLLLWIFYLRFHVSTDDAYANGNMININPVVSGSVVAFYTDDTDLVEEGQLLVQLDETDFAIGYKRELATLASVVLQVRQLYSNVSATDAQKESRKITLAQTKFDYENRLRLVDSRAVSKEDFIHAQDAYLRAEKELNYATSQWNTAKAAAGNTPPEEHPLIQQQKGNIRNAYFNLKHCAIYAPARGYVAQRTVDVGQRVSSTTNMMAIIPTDYVWVDANFKETQLNHMRIGQPATVTFDLYGSGVKFEGKVIGIASGSGSVFSIIPPQNATGNWIKIVQRLPVRISLDPKKIECYPVRLGISANVTVDISNLDLPMLALHASLTPVGRTNVFDLDLAGVEMVMNEIIWSNMRSKEPSP